MTKRKCQSVSEYRETSRSEGAGSQEEPLLSPRRAFVVQFREEADVGRTRFRGRVEHLVSGRAMRFHSPEELLAFLAEVLSTIRTKPP